MAFKVTFHLKKDRNTAWFSQIFLRDQLEERKFLTSSAGYVSNKIVLVTDTDNISEVIFDTSEHYIAFHTGRWSVDWYKTKLDYFIDNNIEVIITYETL